MKQFHQERSDHFLRVTISGLEKDFLAVAFSLIYSQKLRKARYGLGHNDSHQSVFENRSKMAFAVLN